MGTIIAAGLDLGTSGKSSVAIVKGDYDFRVKCVHLEAFQGVSGPELEVGIERIHGKFQPNLWLMEMNGPGEIFAGYIQRNKPHIPLATIDTSLPLPEDYKIILWDEIEIGTKLVLNIRAAMYWILRLFFRDERTKIYREDEELFAQLSVLRWDNDIARGDKIFMLSKRKLRFATSDLDEEPFSKSPDKADSLALAHFAYVLLQQQGEQDVTQEEGQSEMIIDPTTQGFFPLVGFDEGGEDYA